MKNKFLSRIGQWHTPPYLRKCLTSLKALTLLLVMLMSVNVWGDETIGTYEFTNGATMPSGVVNSGGVAFATSRFCFDTKNDNIVITPSIPVNAATLHVTVTGIMNSTTATAGEITISGLDSKGIEIDGTAGKYTQTTGDAGTVKKIDEGAKEETTIDFSATNVVSIKINCSTWSKKYIVRKVVITCTLGDDPDPTEPSLSVSPATIDFGVVAVGGSVDAQDVTATLTNTDYAIATLSGTNADAFEITAGEELTETGTITVQPKATTLATEGTYSATLEVEAEGVDDPKTVTISLVVVKPFTGNTWTLDKDDFTTGGYGSGTKTVDDIEISYTDVYQNSSAIQFKKTSGVIYNTTDFGKIEKIEITKTGNNNLNVYPGTSSNPTENAILGVASGNVTTYTFPTDENYGYFAIGKGSGASNVTPIKVFYYPIKSDITIDDNCENGSVFVTSPTILTQVASGTEITLGNTPDAGYTLGEYEVYKTGESATKVTITDGKFKMPAYGVTVSATFKTAKVLNSVEITTPASKTKYWIGEEFSTDGLVLTAHFADGDEVVTPTSITTPDMTTAGEKTITVSFTEGTTTKSDEYTITVKNTVNTKETAFTVAEAIDIIDKKLASTTEVYVKGIVSKIDSYNSTYKSITYWISEDGTTTNQFEIYSGKNIGNTDFSSKEDLSVGEVLIIYGIIKDFKGTKEMDMNNYIVERVKVLQSIALSGEYPTEFSLNDDFSHEGQVVTASYNYDDDQNVTEFAEWSGYDMSQAGTQEVTVTYTENSIEKTAKYNITITKPCTSPITITKGAEVNGTFELSKVGYFCLDDEEGNMVSTVLTAEPAEHYHLASVTAEGCTIGAIEDNQCTISDIVADVTITANFVEDAKATATFVKGEEAATGDAPANIEQYVGEEITLPANTFAYAGHVFAGWSDGNNVYQANDKYTLTVNTEFTATWNELPIWATTYTSNVTISGNKVKLDEAYQPADYPEDGYDAKKDGSGSAAASISVKVPANTTGLHYHLFAWKGEGGKTVSIKKGGTVLATFTNIADDGVSGASTTYELINNPVDAYGYVALEDITEETTITFSTPSKNNRICLFGVNAIQPAAITIDPASKNFGEVKQGFNAEQVFSLTPNAFATGTITAEIDGEGFSASAVIDNKVTVTFAPTEITEYNATLIIKHDGTQMCTATLTGKGITPTTPEIVVYDDEIDFGKVKQDATVADQAVTVTLNYLDAATASIDDDTYFSIDKTDLGAGANTITISAKATASGTKNATITITGEGATTKTIAVKMDVTSKWAGEYTSNVKVESDKVIIAEEEYEAVKAGTGKVAGSTTITVPEGAYALHFHAAGWNNEDVTLSVKNGDTELGPFDLYKDAGVTGNSPFTLQGENYDTDQYFYVEFDALEEETTFTFAATSGNRFVLYGVNQEGGVLPVLDHITIDGEATKLNYNTTDAFDPVGLTVSAVYTLKGVEQTPVPVTENVNWTFDPATFNEVGEGLSVTATASFTDGEVTKTADKVITGISVEEATPSIFASKVNIEFGEVIQGATVEPIQSKITLKYIDEVSVTLSDATAFSIDKTSMTETDYLTISAVTSAEVGEYTATVTIKDLASETSKVLNLSITIKEAPQAESYTLVTDASTLKAGDIVVMAATYSNKTYVNGDLSGDLLTCVEATLTDDVLSAVGACEFVLGGEEGAWTLTSTKALGATAVKKLTYDDTKTGFVGTWTISISNNVATIAPDAEGYGRFMYNHNNGGNRFLTYTSNTSASMLLPQLYRKPVYETIRTDMTDGQIGTGCQTKNILDVKGATLYQVNYTYGCYLEFMEVTYPVAAGMPIIMQADGTNGGKVEVLYGENEVTEAIYNDDGLHGYIGVGQCDIPGGYPYYVFKGGMLRPSQGNYTTSGHAYIKLDEVPTENQLAGSPAPRRRMSVGIERSMPTGFETIMMQKGMNKVIMNNQLFLIRDGKLFNAQGALVK